MRARRRAREVTLDGHADTIAAPREPERIPDAAIARYIDALPPGQRAVVTALALEGESVGTVVDRQAASTASLSKPRRASRPASCTSSSSAVRPRVVAMRHSVTRRSPSNKPRTVFVLPTSTVSSTEVARSTTGAA